MLLKNQPNFSSRHEIEVYKGPTSPAELRSKTSSFEIELKFTRGQKKRDNWSMPFQKLVCRNFK